MAELLAKSTQSGIIASFIYKGQPMSEFENVTIVKKANVYFGGNVSSRTIKFYCRVPNGKM